MYDFTRLTTIFKKAKPEILNLLNQEYILVQGGLITQKRIAHFIAQMAWESDGFHTLTEYASGKAYEGRKDLGNTVPGDGPRYKGRGLIQLTGRYNYRKYGKALGIDLERNPDLAVQYALQIALKYWNDKGLNFLADKDDIRGITKAINGGYNGLEGREHYYNLVRDINFNVNAKTAEGTPPGALFTKNIFVAVYEFIQFLRGK